MIETFKNTYYTYAILHLRYCAVIGRRALHCSYCASCKSKVSVALVTTHTDTGWFLQTGVLYAVKTITSKHKTTSANDTVLIYARNKTQKCDTNTHVEMICINRK